LIVLRAMLQLANAAADAVRDRVADAEAIDAAMKFGANYPIGPMAFVAEYGAGAAVAALGKIADETGDPSYRPGETLRAIARKSVPH
jgi:3-hydroxybutyryl-CoA dehydrogenase